jgi:hypothetical protein
MDVRGQLNDPVVLSPRKEVLVQFRQKTGWSLRAGLDAMEKERTLTLLGIEPGLPTWGQCNIPKHIREICLLQVEHVAYKSDGCNRRTPKGI